MAFCRLRLAEQEVEALRRRPPPPLVADYERQLHRLREEVALLTSRRAELIDGCVRVGLSVQVYVLLTVSLTWHHHNT